MAVPHVLIAGAGPVGLAVATMLGRAGVDVTVLEKGDGPGSASRASTFHPPALEFCAELGVVDELHARGLHAPTFQLRDRTAGVVAEFDLSLLVDDTPYPYRVQLEQSKFCQLLADRLPASVTLRTGARVADVAHDDAGYASPLPTASR
jgi:2-polyprenyl-6-methoxyphenol hydroxylase-like FAD-dependent oxidoreductase